MRSEHFLCVHITFLRVVGVLLCEILVDDNGFNWRRIVVAAMAANVCRKFDIFKIRSDRGAENATEADEAKEKKATGEL